MRALSAADLVQAWERGLPQSLPQRALTLLALACSETPIERLARLSIGRRDSLLLRLREITFGRQLAGMTTCPACGERLEFCIDTTSIQTAGPADSGEVLELTHEHYEVKARLPHSLDVQNLDATADADGNRRQLLRQCVLSVRCGGTEVPVEALPDEIAVAVAQRMAEADPQADVQLVLKCSQCHHHWQAPLDIVAFFWSEIHAWAARILREVHVLASAYGWSESAVLALSPWRRRMYLEMAER